MASTVYDFAGFKVPATVRSTVVNVPVRVILNQSEERTGAQPERQREPRPQAKPGRPADERAAERERVVGLARVHGQPHRSDVGRPPGRRGAQEQVARVDPQRQSRRGKR